MLPPSTSTAASASTSHTLHCCSRWSAQLETTLGAATAQLLRLGAHLAADPA